MREEVLFAARQILASAPTVIPETKTQIRTYQALVNAGLAADITDVTQADALILSTIQSIQAPGSSPHPFETYLSHIPHHEKNRILVAYSGKAQQENEQIKELIHEYLIENLHGLSPQQAIIKIYAAIINSGQIDRYLDPYDDITLPVETIHQLLKDKIQHALAAINIGREIKLPTDLFEYIEQEKKDELIKLRHAKRLKAAENFAAELRKEANSTKNKIILAYTLLLNNNSNIDATTSDVQDGFAMYANLFINGFLDLKPHDPLYSLAYLQVVQEASSDCMQQLAALRPELFFDELKRFYTEFQTSFKQEPLFTELKTFLTTALDHELGKSNDEIPEKVKQIIASIKQKIAEKIQQKEQEQSTSFTQLLGKRSLSSDWSRKLKSGWEEIEEALTRYYEQQALLDLKLEKLHRTALAKQKAGNISDCIHHLRIMTHENDSLSSHPFGLLLDDPRVNDYLISYLKQAKKFLWVKIGKDSFNLIDYLCSNNPDTEQWRPLKAILDNLDSVMDKEIIEFYRLIKPLFQRDATTQDTQNPNIIANLKKLPPENLAKLAEFFSKPHALIPGEKRPRCIIEILFRSLITLAPQTSTEDKCNAYLKLAESYMQAPAQIGYPLIRTASIHERVLSAFNCVVAAQKLINDATQPIQLTEELRQPALLAIDLIYRIIHNQPISGFVASPAEKSRILKDVLALLDVVRPHNTRKTDLPTIYTLLHEDISALLDVKTAHDVFKQDKWPFSYAEINTSLPLENYQAITTSTMPLDKSVLRYAETLFEYGNFHITAVPNNYLALRRAMQYWSKSLSLLLHHVHHNTFSDNTDHERLVTKITDEIKRQLDQLPDNDDVKKKALKLLDKSRDIFSSSARVDTPTEAASNIPSAHDLLKAYKELREICDNYIVHLVREYQKEEKKTQQQDSSITLLSPEEIIQMFRHSSVKKLDNPVVYKAHHIMFYDDKPSVEVSHKRGLFKILERFEALKLDEDSSDTNCQRAWEHLQAYHHKCKEIAHTKTALDRMPHTIFQRRAPILSDIAIRRLLIASAVVLGVLGLIGLGAAFLASGIKYRDIRFWNHLRAGTTGEKVLEKSESVFKHSLVK